MIQAYDIEFFRIVIHFDKKLIYRLVDYCDRKIVSNEVDCDLIFDLSLCASREIDEIDYMCRESIGRIDNEMPSNVALAYLSRKYRESRFDINLIDELTYGIYSYIPVMDDSIRMSFLNIGQSVYDIERYGSKNNILERLDREFCKFVFYENEIPL